MFILDFTLARVFYLVGKMLENKEPISSLEVAQDITKPSIEEDLAKLHTRLTVEAIAVFDKVVSQQTMPHPLSNIPLAMIVIYLVDIITRSSCERHSI